MVVSRVFPASDEPLTAKDEPLTTTKVIRRFKVLASAPKFFCLYKICVAPIASAVVLPKIYFAASNELVLLTLIVCWTITLIYDHHQALDHPARNFVGHFNPCFGWDYPPASYIAVCAAGLDVHLAFRYASLESMRTKLLDYDQQLMWAEKFAIVTAWLHAVAAILWLLLWSVGPPDNNWVVHLTIFTVCVLLRYLCTLGNYLEQRYSTDPKARARVTRGMTIHVSLYGTVTGILPVLYFTDIVIYKAQGRVGVDPPIPWPVLQAMDLLWMLMLATANRFRVPEPPILVLRRILQFGEEYEIEDKDAEISLKGRKGRTLEGVEMIND